MEDDDAEAELFDDEEEAAQNPTRPTGLQIMDEITRSARLKSMSYTSRSSKAGSTGFDPICLFIAEKDLAPTPRRC